MDNTGAAPRTQFTEEYVSARWLLFLAAPSKPGPDETNRFDLGNIGETPEKNWMKMTPYSLAQLKNPLALVNTNHVCSER